MVSSDHNLIFTVFGIMLWGLTRRAVTLLSCILKILHTVVLGQFGWVIMKVRVVGVVKVVRVLCHICDGRTYVQVKVGHYSPFGQNSQLQIPDTDRKFLDARRGRWWFVLQIFLLVKGNHLAVLLVTAVVTVLEWKRAFREDRADTVENQPQCCHICSPFRHTCRSCR